ncbi:MAG: superinfection immunity protein [Candidatus Omnitrophota bacterium]
MLIVLIFGLYFLPFLIASLRQHKNILAIFLLNLALGWTFLGWIAALIWSVTK